MFNSISGTITAKLPSSLFLDNGGLEWDISVPSFSLDFFGSVGTSARVYTWLYHREDQMKLFGFATIRERDMFLDLMKVDGIGPKQALKIISSIRSEDLEAALDGEDLARLESAPGIGKKTAQKMILALKGKLTYDTGSSRKGKETLSKYEDVLVALTGMGFDRKNAFEALDRTGSDLLAETPVLKGADFEKELFRRAIVALSR